ncbi:MAG: TraR/DksA C4-type zinc finger protein [Candidatus Omnitrophota bacterium]
MPKAKKERKSLKKSKARIKKTAKKIPVKKKIAKKNAPKKTAKKLKKIPADELKAFKALLLIERTKLTEEISSISKEHLMKSQKDATGDLSGYSFHMADVASDNYEREFSLGLASAEQKRLYAIDDALRRVADGTYGNCQSCEKPIAKKRLKAIPQTELCIVCQKSQEEKRCDGSI